MKNKVCVYAIAKNESKFVDRWVDSMSEADAIVVLDTGSTDDTVEKLMARGVTVSVKEIKPWRFDVARNEAMKLVPDDCNILFSTDLDEILEPGWGDALRSKWIDGKHTRGMYKYVWSHLPTGEPARTFMYNKIHTREWEWLYPVHELLVNKRTGSGNYQYEDQLDLFDIVTLHHYPDQEKSRGSYLPLLEQRESEYPNDMFGLIYLAHEYNYRGMPDKSNEKLKKVLNNFKDQISPVEEASCYLFMGDNYSNEGMDEEAISSYLHGIKAEPTYRECYMNLAKEYIKLERHQDAVDCIKEGIRRSVRHYTWLERDTSWSYEPYDLLCLAYYYGGHKLKSLGCAYKALSFAPNDQRLIDNVRICLDSLSDLDIVEDR